MHDKTARVFSGLGVLVVVWIIVYWSWPVKDDGSSLGELSVGEVLPIESAGDDDRQTPGGRERFPLVPPDGDAEDQAPRAPVPPPDNGSAASAGDDAGVIPPEFRAYAVVGGDNFERISQKVYGTRRHAMAIATANPLLDPRKLREGMTIRVPVDPGNIQGQPVDEDAGPGDDETPDSMPIIEYTVSRGDTLSSIAKAFYGSVRYVDFLYDANRDRLSSKDDLRLGQVLLIPPLPEGAD